MRPWPPHPTCPGPCSFLSPSTWSLRRFVNRAQKLCICTSPLILTPPRHGLKLLLLLPHGHSCLATGLPARSPGYRARLAWVHTSTLCPERCVTLGQSLLVFRVDWAYSVDLAGPPRAVQSSCSSSCFPPLAQLLTAAPLHAAQDDLPADARGAHARAGCRRAALAARGRLRGPHSRQSGCAPLATLCRRHFAIGHARDVTPDALHATLPFLCLVL